MLKSILLLIAFSVVCCTSSKLFGASVDCAVNRFLEHLEAEQTENLDSALYQLDQEIAISSYRFDTSCLVEIYRSYAMSKGTQGNYYLVFRALWKSLLLADQAQLKREQFRVNIDIARYYGYLKRYKKAEEHFQHASVLKKELSLTNLLADSMAIDFYFYQMKMYKRRGNKDMAVKYLDSCYQHIDFNNVDQRFYYLEFERAIFLADQERYEAALDIYREMLDSIKQHNPGYQGIMYTHIGNALWNLARHEESLQAYQRGLQAIDTHQEHIDFLPYLYQRLGEIHFSQGHFKEAYLIQQKREKLGFKMYDSRSRLNNLLLNVQDDFRLYKEEEQGRSRKQAFVQLEQEQKLLLFQRILLLGALLFVGLLTVAFLQMQREKINSEKAINQQLQKQNLEKEAFLEQIAKKNQELITFSNIMSHDLKAPLRTIASFSGLIKKQIHGSFEKESILEYFNFITDATKSMTNLIEDLLVYSKVNLEESQLVSIDLNDLLITLLPDFSYDLNTGKVIIEIDKLPIVEGNKSLLKTVFHNLISNAIKYQPKGEQNHQAHVKIWCEESESDHQVFIQDNGIGIEPEYVDRLFQPFVRFHSSAEYVGTGLGMSICQRIMSNHEGRIDLADTSPRGSLFKLTFPRTKCQITSVNTIDPSVKELSTAS